MRLPEPDFIIRNKNENAGVPSSLFLQWLVERVIHVTREQLVDSTDVRCISRNKYTHARAAARTEYGVLFLALNNTPAQHSRRTATGELHRAQRSRERTLKDATRQIGATASYVANIRILAKKGRRRPKKPTPAAPRLSGLRGLGVLLFYNSQLRDTCHMRKHIHAAALRSLQTDAAAWLALRAQGE